MKNEKRKGKMKGKIEVLKYREAIDFLLPKHYSGRKPNVKIAFGWFIEQKLVAVVSFGKPASNTLCDGVCGKEFSSNVYELNRLCRVDELQEQLSQFVSACLRRISLNNWIIVSYADTAMSHNGYIYQACNFLYTGKTKRRTDKYTEGNKHSRHYDKNAEEVYRKVRSAKHRYIFFATKKKKLKKQWLKSLNYDIEPYPKDENKLYKLGEYQKPEIIKVKK